VARGDSADGYEIPVRSFAKDGPIRSLGLIGKPKKAHNGEKNKATRAEQGNFPCRQSPLWTMTGIY
jgi:hypothetical protein